jgi:integrase
VEPKVSILVKLLYGGGLRLSEALRLRVKDLDFAHGCVMVRDGKGGKDRRTTLPAGLVEPLREHLRRVQILFNQDRAEGLDGVFMPNQLVSPASLGGAGRAKGGEGSGGSGGHPQAGDASCNEA